MLLRRFAREMGRLTPDVAEVTAEEHMIRDGGSLRRTLEVVGQSRMANVLRAGEKRAADEDLDEADERASEVDRMGLGMTDIEKSARKRSVARPLIAPAELKRIVAGNGCILRKPMAHTKVRRSARMCGRR